VGSVHKHVYANEAGKEFPLMLQHKLNIPPLKEVSYYTTIEVRYKLSVSSE
jgi:hypothetical protein